MLGSPQAGLHLLRRHSVLCLLKHFDCMPLRSGGMSSCKSSSSFYEFLAAVMLILKNSTRDCRGDLSSAAIEVRCTQQC